ncbi:MAG: alpha/beta hydrolase [Chloroflexi bacterium]|nr:alpha/beta hydrolase [Chloroflexota bacterium]
MSYKFADVNGVRMHYDVQGEGFPLVLIHAGIANLTMWEKQMPAFTKHFRVIRNDVRGFGETPDPAGKYTDYDDLKTLLDFLEIKCAHVLGISNGGRIAMEFALTFPEMVDKLVLVAPGLPGNSAPEDKFDEEMSAKYEAAIKSGNNELAAEINAQLWVDGPGRSPEQVDKGFREWALQLIRHTVDVGIGEGEGAYAQPLAAKRLRGLEAPTLLILGEEDLQAMHAIADEIEHGIKNIKRVDMPGTAHLPPMEKPEAFNRIVLDFLLEQ